MILTRKIFSRFSKLEAGRLYTWTKKQPPQPVQLPQKVLKASVGPNHILALTQSGKVYSFGSNENGELGHNDKANYPRPKLIQYFEKNNIKVKDAICGEKHSVVLDQKGEVYTFGYGGLQKGIILGLFYNTIGPLGHGNSTGCLKPTRVKGLEGKFIQRITCGRQFTSAIDKDGNVYNWGNGEYGAFGDGRNSNSKVPFLNQYFTYLKNEQKQTIKKIKSCQSYSIALMSDGKLYGWGSNQSGQMGVKSQIGIQIYETVNFPTEVIRQGYQSQKVVNFDISDNTLIFQLSNGQLWWAGMKMAYKPQKIKINTKPKLFAAGQRSFVIVDQQNKIFFGQDYLGVKSQQNLETGIKSVDGTELFKGNIVGIGGQYQRRYVIVK